jgi:hypothetical protein
MQRIIIRCFITYIWNTAAIILTSNDIITNLSIQNRSLNGFCILYQFYFIYILFLLLKVSSNNFMIVLLTFSLIWLIDTLMNVVQPFVLQVIPFVNIVSLTWNAYSALCRGKELRSKCVFSVLFFVSLLLFKS